MELKATKDPDATKDYSVDWSDYLNQVEDSIVSSVWFADDPALVIEGDAIGGPTRTVAFISGGTAGKNYQLTNRITTASTPIARVEDRTMIIPVRHT